MLSHDWGIWDEIAGVVTAIVTAVVVWLLSREHYTRPRRVMIDVVSDGAYVAPRSYWRFAKRVWLTVAALLLGNGTAMLASGHRALAVIFILCGVPLVLALLRDGHIDDMLSRTQYSAAERVWRPVRVLRATVTVTPRDGQEPEIIVHVPTKGETDGDTE
jgi:hypothetical protein